MTSSPVFDTPDLPDYDSIRAAAIRLRGVAVATPVLESPGLNARLGFRLLIKAESLQRTGSFKFRGAYNKLVQLDPDARTRGVVAFSSGNHAQGVAAAAALLGIRATIIMPADAPANKLARTRASGAVIVTYDRYTEDREAIAGAVAAEQGATLVRPFDDKDIIAGQGTAGLELIEQALIAGVTLDALIAPASGGGLVAGCALACKALSPATRIYCAEPAGFDDHAKSLAAGQRISNPAGAKSIADALLAPIPGEITFALNRWLLAGGLVVTDDDIRAAMRLAFDEFRIIVEPGGAVALAAALTGRVPGNPATIAVLASGGNVDVVDYSRLLADA